MRINDNVIELTPRECRALTAFAGDSGSNFEGVCIDPKEGWVAATNGHVLITLREPGCVPFGGERCSVRSGDIDTARKQVGARGIVRIELVKNGTPRIHGTSGYVLDSRFVYVNDYRFPDVNSVMPARQTSKQRCSAAFGVDTRYLALLPLVHAAVCDESQFKTLKQDDNSSHTAPVTSIHSPDDPIRFDFDNGGSSVATVLIMPCRAPR